MEKLPLFFFGFFPSTYFTAEKQKALNLKQQIAATDNEIDRMVYELYGLTEEEIRIVEGE